MLNSPIRIFSAESSASECWNDHVPYSWKTWRKCGKNIKVWWMINFIVKQVTLHHNKHKNILIQFEIYYRKYTFKPYWVPVLTHYITTCDEISKWKQIDDIKCGNVSDGNITLFLRSRKISCFAGEPIPRKINLRNY